MNTLYIESIRINRESDVLKTSYLRQISAIRETDEIVLHSPVTFLTGENGSGKSTLLEAVAIACGLNPEGGTRNYAFSTYNDYSALHGAIMLRRGASHPKWSYFLRAESFYNVATTALTHYNDDDMMPDYHSRSHGESFLGFIQDNAQRGLYLMDEPEAALSPQNQLTLLLLLHRMAKNGSQFIIATHSPILLAIPDAEILTFDDGPVRSIDYDDAGCCQITRMFMENRERVLRQLLQED